MNERIEMLVKLASTSGEKRRKKSHAEVGATLGALAGGAHGLVSGGARYAVEGAMKPALKRSILQTKAQDMRRRAERKNTPTGDFVPKGKVVPSLREKAQLGRIDKAFNNIRRTQKVKYVGRALATTAVGSGLGAAVGALRDSRRKKKKGE